MNRDELEVPPHDINAEAAALCEMMISRKALYEGLSTLNKDFFYKDAHRLIFESMGNLASTETGVDLVTVIDELKSRGKLEDAGGTPYISDLAEMSVSDAMIEDHIKIIKKTAISRFVINDCRKAITACGSNVDVKDIIEKMSGKYYEYYAELDEGFTATMEDNIKVVLEEVEDRQRKDYVDNSIYTDIPELDYKIGGFRKGQYIVLGGRPSNGKTALATTLAMRQAAYNKRSVAFFSIEMEKSKLTARMISSHSRIDLKRVLTSKHLDQGEIQRIIMAGELLAEAPLHIDDNSSMNSMDMRAKIMTLSADEDIKLIIIDYAQLMRAVMKQNTLRETVTQISHEVKAMAKDLAIPTILLSQLSRAPVKRNDHRPALSDLRESGALEEDADVVLFTHLPGKYNEEKPEDEAEIVVAKNRNGPTGVVPVRFVKEYVLFQGLSEPINPDRI